MAGIPIGPLGTLVVQLASKVQELGNNYYAADSAWRDFPFQVELLQTKHACLEAQLRKYGQDTFTLELGRVLLEAKKLMVDEVDTLKKRKALENTLSGWSNRSAIVFGRLGAMIFSEKVGSAIRNANGAYDRFVEHLKARQESEDTLRVSTSRSPIPLSFRRDCKNWYVPFHDSESNIVSALASAGPGSPTVILLYGGPGTGKSTVTRKVSSAYAEHKSLFGHVILLECRPALDVQAKEVELIQKPGWNDLGEISLLRLEVEVDGSKFIRESRLRSLLGGRKLLIVLDDLQEPQFLQNLLVLSGPEVKYLVTSPLKGLCENLNCISEKFQIENLHHQSMKDTSKKMLAAHIGFADQLIPENFQEIADSILDKAEGIPLVIATLGAQIGDGDKDDPAVWKSVSSTFLQCLNEIPSKSIHGIPYPRSYWLALTESIDVLNREEKMLLILIGMCKGPSIPKVVVFSLFSILCPNRKSSFHHFSNMRTKLLNRQLIFETSARDKHLSIHSLTKRFILEEIEDTKAIAQSFSHEFEDSHIEAKEHKGFVKKPNVISVLVCLYLDINFGKAIAERIGYSIDTFSASKKITIEPIMKQLLEPEINWTQELEASASQVFLEFVCNDSLCHDQLSQLLQCPTWVMSTLKFLESISLLDKSFWDKNTIQDIPSRLQSILGARDHPDFQMQAAHTLAGLVSYRLNREKILSTTGVLDQLVSLISQDQNDDLQCSGAKFVVACSFGDRDHFHDHDTLQKLVQFPPLLPTLVTSLGNDRNDRLQRQASRALVNLASTPYTSLKARLFESPQLLESLVASLRKSHNPDLQANAANVIANLAGLGADQAMKERVASFPELIQNLENSLYQDGNLNVRVEAAGALIRLAWTKDNPKLLQSLAVSFEKEEDPILRGRALRGLAHLAYKDDMIPDQILSFPGLLENLVKSLNDDVNCGLIQEEVARALQNLACNTDTDRLLKLVSSPLLLESLVASLGRCQNPSLQANAAGAVANLAGSGADQAIREQIARCPGLLDSLENSLDQDDNPRLQVEAARALVNLESIKDIRKLLQGLTVPFQRNQGAFLRENALVGLSGLACMDDEIKDQILSFPGLLENLVKSLDNDLNCGLQTLAAGRICNLASAVTTSIKVRVLRSPGLLKNLVASLEKFQNPDLQTNAAWAIRYLAGKGADQAIREQIVNFPGLLDNLEKSLDQGDNANLQVEAAIALMNLAYTKVTAKMLQSLAVSFETNQDFFFQEEALRGLADLACGDDTIKDQILTFPGLFHSFIKSLGNERSRDRQWHAARALSNLACAKDTIVKARISNSPLLLESLVASLGKVQNPGLQSHAASAIANLSGAGANAEMRHNIANFPRLLDELVKSLDNDDNSRLQEDAALALSNLPHSLDAEIQSKIASLQLRSS